MTVDHFPECWVTSSKPRLSSREGKSSFYEQLSTICGFLDSNQFSDWLLLHWASTLADTDYGDFQSSSLAFKEEGDIPMKVLAKVKAARIKEEVWGETRREDVHHLTLEHAIRVYKVSVSS